MTSSAVSPNDDTLLFSPEDNNPNLPDQIGQAPWNVLIIDDDEGIHNVTQMSLEDFQFEGCGLNFINAYSAEQARTILSEQDDIALALVDVVMENDHAGLSLVRYIREQLDNQMIRLVLRTGQPGYAPEKKVIQDFDINDYKEKTELTAQKLFSTVYTSLRSYRDLLALEHNRRGLEHIIHASATLFSTPKLDEFIQGVLQQLVALLHLDRDAMLLECECLAVENADGVGQVVAGTGRFEAIVGKKPEQANETRIFELIQAAHQQKESLLLENEFVGYFAPHAGRENVLYVRSRTALSQRDIKLLEMFLHNVSIAYENLLLRLEIEGTQRDIVFMLGEAIETRSKETGQHVRRVSQYCRLIALGMGLDEHQSEIIEIASPLHDFGKIGIPDSILHKAGKLAPDEWEVMQGHASIGHDLLNKSDREILQAASIIAGQHHEQWDGSGYPLGLQGNDIHIYARIASVADVFDALGSKRCYKDAWPLEDIIHYLQHKKGKQFDPAIIDWVMEHVDELTQVREQFPDVE